MANKPNNPALWSRAKSLARQKFDVYPSAYANGWAAKWYKSKGGTWRKGEDGMIMEKGGINNPGFKALPGYVQAKIKANMQEGGMTGSPTVDILNQAMQPQMMQMGGMMPQTSEGQSVLREAMMMSKMQEGGKMPTNVARARFMAAANGNSSVAKAKASQYGYKLQDGGEMPSSAESVGLVDIRKKRSFGERLAGSYRQAKKALGMDPYPKTEFQENLSSITQEIRDKETASQAASKKANRNLAQRIGDEFPTYLNLTADRNVLTDIADIGSAAAQGVGMSSVSQGLQSGKRAVQSFGKTVVGKGLDMVNPLTIGANIVGGSVGTAGDIAQGQGGDAASRLATTSALALTKGAAGKLAGSATSSVGKGASKFVGEKVGKGIGHQAAHAGQHTLLSPLLVHKKGGTIQEMYMMKKGGQFPDRYKKMGFKGVDQPKKTTSGNKSHAVVTKVDGNYKLIRFGQKGEVGSPDGTARNKAFKARHAKNIAKGKSSAAYWANKIKWILFIPLMLCQTL